MGLIKNLNPDGISTVAPEILQAAFHAVRNACFVELQQYCKLLSDSLKEIIPFVLMLSFVFYL